MALQKRVSELPAVTTVAGTDLLIVSSNNATKRTSVQQIGAYFAANGVAGPQGPVGPAGAPGATNYTQLTNVPSTFPPSAHTHTAAQITDFTAAVVAAAPPTTNASLLTSGTLDAARLPGSVVLTTDARLSDARQPLTHTHTASQITDFTSAVVAAAPPTTNASLLTSGTLPDARLSSAIARTSDVSSAVAAVVGAAPESLNTLQELSAALANDASFATTVTNSLSGKANTSHTHGNITSDGKIGTTGGLFVYTGTAGELVADNRIVVSGSTITLTNTTVIANCSAFQTTGIATLGGITSTATFRMAAGALGSTNFNTSTFIITATGEVIVGQWQATAIAVAYGGTGATTASAARTNLGLAIGTDVPALSHTHSASAITDFASAVAAAAPAEVLDFLTAAQFPATGLASKIYVATDHSRAYQWTGSQYAEIGPAGAFLPVHSHAASEITSGVISTARLPLSTTAQALAGTNAATVLTPAAMHVARRGSGRAKFFELFTDFAINGSGFNAGTDGFLFQTDFSGAGSSGTTNGTTLSSFAGRVGAGLFTCSTGTASTGRSGFDSRETQTVFRFDAGTTTYETLVYLPNLADATDDYIFRIGFCQGNALSNDVMCFEYNRANSANWVGVTGFNGGYNRVTSGVAVAETKWILLRMVFTSASCEFFVNDVSIGTSSSSIRADGGCRIGCHLLKTAGTTSRSALVDFVYVRHDFNSDRTFT